MSWISKGPAAEVAVEVEAAVVGVAEEEAEVVESMRRTWSRGRPAWGAEAAPCLGPDSDY